jgi:predicted DNA-binding protein (UPF0251 family)
MRPGRPRCPRRIEREPDITYFKPRGIPLNQLGVVIITFEELETVRLTDIEEREQEQGAHLMGVSRRAFWEDLQSARRKIAEALVEGKAIRIEGGSYWVDRRTTLGCQVCQYEWKELLETNNSQKCPKCGGMSTYKKPDVNCLVNSNDHRRNCSCKGRRTPKADHL